MKGLYTDLHVRDCMVWKENKNAAAKGKGRARPPSREATPKVAQPSKHTVKQTAELGKSKSYGYEIKEDSGPAVVHRDDEGSAIEALRGWPRDRKAYQTYDYVDDGCQSPEPTHEAREPTPAAADVPAIQSTSEEHAHGRKPKGSIKTNKTALLRQIKQEEEILAQNRPLWKMPKFTKNAKPKLSTFRGKSSTQNGFADGPAGSRAGSRTGSRAGSRPVSGMDAGACACGLHLYGEDYRHLATEGQDEPDIQAEV